MSDEMSGGIDRQLIVSGAVAGAIAGVIIAVFYRRWIQGSRQQGRAEPDDLKRMLTFVATVAGVGRQFIEIIS